MSKRKHNYTLTEMLAVVAIIAILAGLLFPVINSSRERARETQAVGGCNAIATALRQYKMSYSKFPSITTSDPVGGGSGSSAGASIPTTETSSDNKYDKIIFALSGVLPGGSSNDSKFKELNRKKTSFLESPADYMKTSTSFYANSWGRRYYIKYGSAGDKMLKFKRAKNGSLDSSKTFKVGTDVAVFSEVNPNTKEFKNGTRFATSWGGILDVK